VSDKLKDKVASEIASRVTSDIVIGVGTGSTVDLAIKKIGAKVTAQQLNLKVICSSEESSKACEANGLTVMYPGYAGTIDWGFDGADAVDKNLWAIKGGGAALLREKILAVRCKKYILIVDDSKLVENIAAKSVVPVEIIPEALSYVQRQLVQFNPRQIVLRQGTGKYGSVITEKGNFLIDVEFSAITPDLANKLKCIVGVVETGLFIDCVDEILVASPAGVTSLKK